MSNKVGTDRYYEMPVTKIGETIQFKEQQILAVHVVDEDEYDVLLDTGVFQLMVMSVSYADIIPALEDQLKKVIKIYTDKTPSLYLLFSKKGKKVRTWIRDNIELSTC